MIVPDRYPPIALLHLTVGKVRLSEVLKLVAPAVTREMVTGLRPYWRWPALPDQPTITATRLPGELITLLTVTCDGRESTHRETEWLLHLDAKGVNIVQMVAQRAYQTVRARWLVRHHGALTLAARTAGGVIDAELRVAERAAHRRRPRKTERARAESS